MLNIILYLIALISGMLAFAGVSGGQGVMTTLWALSSLRTASIAAP